MKILAFAGSSSIHSINKKLVKFALSQLQGQHEIELLDLNDYEMPIYSIDKETSSGIHPLALQFAAKIDQCDLIIVSLAEHNGAYSTAFKNIFDWVSRMPGRKVWGGKNMILMATSPGSRGGLNVLEIAKNKFPNSGANILGTFSLPNFEQNFSEDKGIIDENKQLELLSVLSLI